MVNMVRPRVPRFSQLRTTNLQRKVQKSIPESTLLAWESMILAQDPRIFVENAA
jgi:hypothetical protein